MIRTAPQQWQSHNGQGQFGSVVGKFDHEVVLQGGEGEPHARMDIAAGGDHYEADVNVHSVLNPDGSHGGSNVLYAIKDRVVNQMPTPGEHVGGTVSYENEGLTPSDFHQVDDDTLHQQLINLAQQSDEVAMYGQIYHDANSSGIHDIHMNNNNDNPRMNDPGHDGVARFYINENGVIHEESVYIMFQSQHL